MLAGTIWRFWWTRGQIAEASRWYERAFAVAANASEIARARGLFGAAHMAEARGDVDQARSQFEESAGLFRRLGETRWLILALAHLSGAYGDSDPRAREGDPDRSPRARRGERRPPWRGDRKGKSGRQPSCRGRRRTCSGATSGSPRRSPCARRHLRGGNLSRQTSGSSRAAAETSTAQPPTSARVWSSAIRFTTYSRFRGRSRSPLLWCSRVVIRTLPPACARRTRSSAGSRLRLGPGGEHK